MTSPSKIQKVKDWPRPHNVKQVRGFLGLSSYYRKFTQNFSTVAKPLYALTELKKDFIWTESCEESFQKLKQSLISAPTLAFPKDDGQYILDTDASNTGSGAVLSQVQDGQEKVIGYFSKVFAKPERKYCTTRKELLAMIKAIRYFHYYLAGRKFLLRTDHGSLRWLTKFKNTDGQLARWLEVLSEYNYEIQHRAGLKHTNADALSRRICDDCKYCRRQEVKLENEILSYNASIESFPESLQEQRQKFLTAQDADPDIKYVKQRVLKGWPKPRKEERMAQSKSVKNLINYYEMLEIKNGILCRRFENEDGTEQILQQIVPRSMRKDILELCHDGRTGGHFGRDRTMNRVRSKFYWFNFHEDVQRWVRSCETCQAVKGANKRNRGPMIKYYCGEPMDRIALDLVGPFSRSKKGNKYLLVVVDYFTKWVECIPLRNHEAPTVAKAVLEEVLTRFGLPQEMHSDQGREFTSHVLKEVCRRLGINKTQTTLQRPQSDGQAERYIRTISTQLKTFVNERGSDWDEHVPYINMLYRATKHKATGYTPNRLMLGREINLPEHIMFPVDRQNEQTPDTYLEKLDEKFQVIGNMARDNIAKAADAMKENYDQRVRVKSYDENQKVWFFHPRRKIGTTTKFIRQWTGPFVVVRKMSDVLYRIKNPKNKKLSVVHVDKLHEYQERTGFDTSV